jgi:sulfofructose kinase
MRRNLPPLWRFADLSRPFDVVGMGQCSLDTVAVVDGLPRFAGKERILEATRLPGGQVATALLACTRLGLRCAFASTVGDDSEAERMLAPLRASGIDLAGVRVRPGVASQTALILVDRKSGERTVLWHRDLRLSLSVGEVTEAQVMAGRVLHLDAGDLEAAVWAAERARAAGIPVVLDADTPAPGIERLLAQVDFPIVSSDFAEKHFGTRSPAEALRGLVALGVRFAVVTLGDRGAVGSDGAQVFESPGFPVAVRDTTGAGDVFHAAFIWGLLEGLGAVEILRAASAAAAMSCRALGAQSGLPTRAELLAFLREHERAAPAGAAGGPPAT